MTDERGKRWTETQRSWDEVGRNFGEVGKRVSEHYRKLGETGEPAVAEARRTVNDALQTVVHQLDHALTSVGNTFRDPQAKDSLSRAVRSLGDALSATFSDASEEIREKIGSKSSTSDGSGDDSPPTPPSP
jgi:hypothetical protein